MLVTNVYLGLIYVGVDYGTIKESSEASIFVASFLGLRSFLSLTVRKAG